MKLKLIYPVLFLATSLATGQPPVAQPEQPKAHSGGQPAVASDKIWADLIEGNRRFVAGKSKARDLVDLRQSLAKSQHPKAIVSWNQ